MSHKSTEKRQVVVFDFDGTITRRDTFLLFIAFTHGQMRLYAGLLLNIHWFIAHFVFRTISNEILKQRIFAYFFHGMKYEIFRQYGQSFANHIEKFENHKIVGILDSNVKTGNTVFVISASIYEWIQPWCKKHGVENVISTRIEVVNGILTGRFSSKNCYGPEKATRLLLAEPNRNEYVLTIYGNSSGDKEMMALADNKNWI